MVSECSTPVYRFLYRMVGSAEDARDLTQEVFYQAYRNRAAIKRDISPLPYLFTIARRKAISLLRWRTVRRMVNPLTEAHEASVPSEHGDPRQAAGEARLEQALQKALNGLKPDKRAVIALRYFEDRSYSEIAAIMKKPEGTVKTLAFRAERELRSRLDGFDWTDWLGETA